MIGRFDAGIASGAPARFGGNRLFFRTRPKQLPKLLDPARRAEQEAVLKLSSLSDADGNDLRMLCPKPAGSTIIPIGSGIVMVYQMLRA